ncbi:MAG: IS91 family transposase [Bacteroidota bacterium]|nr:IS91 family transposase [Bacteroidota bacterium]
MEQPLSERRQLLQTKIFGHASVAGFNPYSQAVLSRLSRCHTSAIGVHHYRCSNEDCKHIHYQYHSCGNRHCPGCGGMKRVQWVEDRMGELLPTTYFHLVFTLPQELRSLCMGNRKLLFGLLFKAAQHTILTLSKDEKYMGGTPGIVSILHTNGQDLTFHPHVHSIVSGGGINVKDGWIKEKRANGRFLFPRRAMEKIYKGYFLEHLRKYITNKSLVFSSKEALENILSMVGQKKWNVYAKAPFGGPAQIIEYLGRYTHKVAITAHRILQIDESHISFKYKDYTDGNKQKIMKLSHDEFLRRFEQHILPKNFVKIRHAGYLHAKNKMARIAAVCKELKLPAPMQKVYTPVALRLLLQTGRNVIACPVCKKGRMELVKTFIYHNGCLVDAAGLRNRGSPQTKRKYAVHEKSK